MCAGRPISPWPAYVRVSSVDCRLNSLHLYLKPFTSPAGGITRKNPAANMAAGKRIVHAHKGANLQGPIHLNAKVVGVSTNHNTYQDILLDANFHHDALFPFLEHEVRIDSRRGRFKISDSTNSTDFGVKPLSPMVRWILDDVCVRDVRFSTFP